MNQAKTKAELIDPKIKACGWGIEEGSKVLSEYQITQVRFKLTVARKKRN